MEPRGALGSLGVGSGILGGPMWIGIDDTDGPDGGCTTHVLTEVIRAAHSLGVDLVGLPSLVRLNPNIPWKTRGNGALAARFGEGVGTPSPIGRLPEGPLYAYPRGRAVPEPLARALVRSAWAAVLRASSRAARTDPVLVACTRPPALSLYERAVRSVVRIPEARRAVRAVGGEVRSRGSARGLVGAAAAIAWRPGKRTYELLAYRAAGRTGPRSVDPASVELAESGHPGLFQCRDPETRRLLVTPHTPCPILFGLRSTRASELPGALAVIRSEPIERWAIFRTNQGTGDHLVDRAIGSIGPYEAARVTGRLLDDPVRLPGGHVRFTIGDPRDTLDCLAFEPTKTLPKVAASLRKGDRVVLWGGRGKASHLRLEGIEILPSLPGDPRTTRPPLCPSCRRTTSSLGTGRGYRCPGCRTRLPMEAAEPRERDLEFGPGVYHPTPSARRHLHPVVRALRRSPEPGGGRGPRRGAGRE